MLLATLGTDHVEGESAGAVATGVETSQAKAHQVEKPAEIQPLAYRKVLATWPDHWRERWGRRANAIEERGVSWRDAESRAFVEVWSEFRNSPDAFRN